MRICKASIAWVELIFLQEILFRFPYRPNSHAQARSDLNTANAAGAAPYTIYYVNSAVVAHENAHVNYFYQPSFHFWDLQMGLFESVDVEATSVYVIYDDNDVNTRTPAAAVTKAKNDQGWDLKIRNRMDTAMTQGTGLGSEPYALGVEKGIDDAVRAQIPNP